MCLKGQSVSFSAQCLWFSAHLGIDMGLYNIPSSPSLWSFEGLCLFASTVMMTVYLHFIINWWWWKTVRSLLRMLLIFSNGSQIGIQGSKTRGNKVWKKWQSFHRCLHSEWIKYFHEGLSEILHTIFLDNSYK